eukprot:2343479-Pleurochrysis_carterae.AAC.3
MERNLQKKSFVHSELRIRINMPLRCPSWRCWYACALLALLDRASRSSHIANARESADLTAPSRAAATHFLNSTLRSQMKK